MMKLMLLTADPAFAAQAQDAGVDRIFLDLEYINKIERQMGRNTVISHNSVDDVAKLRRVLDRSDLLVRVNPINPSLKAEVDRVIADGADIVMLPMVIDADDAQRFVEMVGGRAKVCLLLETSQALVRMDDFLEMGGVDEIYIGLNDLHISLGLKFMFETLSGGIVEYMAKKAKARNIPFGFGGIAKIGEGMLPADYILGEHYRIGSTSAILSRTFRNETGGAHDPLDLKMEIEKIRSREREIASWTPEQFEENRIFVRNCVNKIVNG